MKPLNFREVERLLRAHGFVLDHSRGSHFIWINPDTGRTVPVPHHGNGPLKQGTLISIFDHAGMPRPQR